MNWIVPSNSKIYKSDEAFEKWGYIDWRQNVKFSVGDIVYIYCTRPLMKVMFKTIVDKVNMEFEDTTDDKEFWIDKEAYKGRKNGKYSRLRLLQKINTEKLGLNMLIKNGLKKAPQAPSRINMQLNKYITKIFKDSYEKKQETANNNEYEAISADFMKKNNLPYEREVISIPASGTINLIYKYRIHAHPNIGKKYPYKKAVYYAFREAGGWMRKLFSLEKTIKLNPQNIDEINNITFNYEIKERLQGYINDRNNSFKFLDDCEYKFYILGKSLELPKAVSLPRQNNQAYFTISEIYSGKDIVERSNEDISTDEENENVDNDNLSEGKIITVKVNKYERNPKARKECLEHYGYRCCICGFDFEEYYGSIGKEIIEVHHKKALHEIKETYVVNPISDLIPVCSNCHTIIHSRNPKFDIEELKSLIKLKN